MITPYHDRNGFPIPPPPERGHLNLIRQHVPWQIAQDRFIKYALPSPDFVRIHLVQNYGRTGYTSLCFLHIRSRFILTDDWLTESTWKRNRPKRFPSLCSLCQKRYHENFLTGDDE